MGMQASPMDTNEKAFANSSLPTHFDTMLRITIVMRPENICTTAPVMKSIVNVFLKNFQD